MISSATVVHRHHLPGLVALMFVLTTLIPLVAAGQSTYLKQVKTSPAGTVKIYATSDPSNYPWITLEFGAASVRVSLSPIDAEAAHSGGAYALEGGTTSGRVTRYTASGSIDTLYASRGVLTVGPGNTRLHEAPSGHLYVLGERLARYTPNGQLDTEFASQPAATVCSTGTRPHDLVVQPDGALVACVGTAGAFVSRITTAGEIRTDYGDAGRAAVPGGAYGRLHLDAGGNARVHTWTPGVFTVSAFNPTGRPLHAPVSLPGVFTTPSQLERLRDPHYARVFGDGTTWMTTPFPSPKKDALGLQGVTPDGQTYGPWPVAQPIYALGLLASPSPGPLLLTGSTEVAVYYQYILSHGTFGGGPYLLNLKDAPGLSPAPTQVSPLGGFVNIPNATLTWRRVPGAVSYDVSLAYYTIAPESVLPLHPPVAGSTTDTTLTLPFSLIQWSRWAWRVRSRGADGRAGAWSTASTFEPQLPPLTLTQFRGRQVTAPVTLIWDDLPALPSLLYTATVSRSRTFATTVWSSQASHGSPTVTTPTLSEGLYYWRVNARTTQGTATYIYSPYSALDSFVVAPANGLLAFPEAPVAASVTFPLWLSWSAAPDATAYDWQVSSTSTFATIADSGRSTILRAKAEVPAGAYYWRVRGRAGATVGAFSPPAPFSVSLPLVPVLLSPDAFTPSPVTVAWQASAGAERYRVHIRSSNTVVLDSLVSATQTTITVPLTQQRVYTVSVAAESGTNGVWSTARSFTTQGTVSADSPALSTASVVVAPNPTAGDLVVRSTSPDVLRYDLVSILGAVVARGSLPEGETTVPRNGLSPGIYVLRVYHSGQPAQTLRVVLR